MSTDTKYNGWTNYETWNVALWIDNDGSDEQWREEAKTFLQQAIDDDESDVKAKATSELADAIQAAHDENMPEIPASTYSDLLGAALSAVNWYEIAGHYVDELEIFSAGCNMPGCLPDSDPCMFLEFDDAKRAIIETIERDADEAGKEDNESLAEDLSALAEDVNLQSAEFSVTVGNRAYWVSKL